MEIDVDGSGKIDRHEMDEFLMRKGIDEEHRSQIIDVVFKKCDVDNSGTIELEEFVAEYLETKNKLEEKQDELTKQIAENHRQVQNLKVSLNNLSKGQSKTPPGVVGVLTITVISGANLPGGASIVRLI